MKQLAGETYIRAWEVGSGVLEDGKDRGGSTLMILMCSDCLVVVVVFLELGVIFGFSVSLSGLTISVQRATSTSLQQEDGPATFSLAAVRYSSGTSAAGGTSRGPMPLIYTYIHTLDPILELALWFEPRVVRYLHQHISFSVQEPGEHLLHRGSSSAHRMPGSGKRESHVGAVPCYFQRRCLHTYLASIQRHFCFWFLPR